MFAVTKRVHATLSWRREGLYEGWDDPNIGPISSFSYFPTNMFSAEHVVIL